MHIDTISRHRTTKTKLDGLPRWEALSARGQMISISSRAAPMRSCRVGRHRSTIPGAPGEEPSEVSPFEQKLSALREAAFHVIDFEGSEREVEEALIGVDRPDCFQTIGQIGSDSLFALWTREPARRRRSRAPERRSGRRRRTTL